MDGWMEPEREEIQQESFTRHLDIIDPLRIGCAALEKAPRFIGSVLRVQSASHVHACKFVAAG